MTDFEFRKSSYSNTGGQCLEVARNIHHTVAVRDSKTSGGPILLLAPAAWVGFTSGLAVAG